MSERKDFFISYTQSDKDWAVWIDNILKNAGYTTILQACDSGFEIEIDFALRNSKQFIAILSKEYLNSTHCSSAWTSAFKKATDTEKEIVASADSGKPVIPMFTLVKIENVELEGLLKPRVYVSLYRYGKTEEGTQELLGAIKPRPIRPLPKLVGSVNFTDRKNNLPHSRNSYFTGRTEILDSINKNLKSNGIAALTQSDSTLIGVGKTAIALEYAYLHESEYETIWWVNAENSNTVLAAYKNKQIISGDAKDKDALDSIRFWFNNNKEWLFIYDNANKDDFKWLESYMPQVFKPSQKCHILITTRSAFFPKCKSLITVPVFNETEAVSFLRKRTDKNDDNYSDASAKMLSEQLKYIPLALEQAATYIEQTPGVTYQDCIALIKKYGMDVFKKQLSGGK